MECRWDVQLLLQLRVLTCNVQLVRKRGGHFATAAKQQNQLSTPWSSYRPCEIQIEATPPAEQNVCVCLAVDTKFGNFFTYISIFSWTSMPSPPLLTRDEDAVPALSSGTKRISKASLRKQPTSLPICRGSTYFQAKTKTKQPH